MRVVIDQERCVGHGRCYESAPAVFDADERGHSVVIDPEVPPEHQEAARLAVANCPERAISIQE